MRPAGFVAILATAAAVLAAGRPGLAEVPVVRAPGGPVKVKPADPGGLKVPFGQQSIYDLLEPGGAPRTGNGGAKRGYAETPGNGRGRNGTVEKIGPYRIQLGSFKDPGTAEKRWKALKETHRDLLGGLSLVIEKVDLGPRGTYFRIQAGPLRTANETKTLCAQLAERKVNCILVRS
jgi:hypothetical protein